VEVTIREATIEDGTALAKLRWDFSDRDEDVEAFAARFREFWTEASQAWTVWVAERDGTIVSNMWLYPVPRVPRPGQGADSYGYLTNVYTAPEARNTGIGAAMLERIVTWAKEQHLEAIYVSPSDESIAFYERAGLSRSDEWMRIEL
jgi:GNAT superfamily N-acetyltransferase